MGLNTSRPDGERCHLSVLFSDLCDYNTLSALNDPEDSDTLHRQLEAVATRIAQKHGGHVSQFYGHGLLAVFGQPQAGEDDARRALECALELHESVRTLSWPGVNPAGFTFRMHSGVHAGLVFLRAGDPLHGRYELTGDAINTAARLMQTAQPDELVVTKSTLSGVEAFFLADEAWEISLKGKAQPLLVQRVHGKTHVQSRYEARQRWGLTPLVGRNTELTLLRGALDDACKGHGRVVLVKGDAGIGKTRLLAELRQRNGDASASMLGGSCDGYGEVAPLQPFLQVIRQMFGLSGRMPRSVAVAKLKTQLDAWGMGAETSTLLGLLSLPLVHDLRMTALASLQALVNVFEAAAQRTAIVLLLDDWQWADEASRDLLLLLTQQLEGRRLCIVLGMRATEAPHLNVEPALILELEPLSEQEASAAIRALRPRDLDLRLRTALHEHCGGNPLFLEELCRSLPQDSAAGERDLERGAVPTTLHGLIQARVARLEPLERHTLQLASVVGVYFSATMLETICEQPLAAVLAVLSREKLLQELGDDSYRFHHGITREVVYETVRIAERKRLHGLIADTLAGASQSPEQLEHPEALAFHYRGSGDFERAARFATVAGDRAAAHALSAAARAHYDSALSALDRLPTTPASIQLWLEISAKWSIQSMHAPARHDLRNHERMLTYAHEIADSAAHAHGEHMLGWYYYLRGDYTLSTNHSHASLTRALQLNDEKLISQLWATLGQAYGAAGDYSQALEFIDRGLASKRSRAKRTGVRRGRATLYAHTLSCRAIIRADVGDFEQALRDNDEAMAILAGSGTSVEPSFWLHRSMVDFHRGAWAQCAESAAVATRTAAHLGNSFVHAKSLVFASCARYKLKPNAATLTQARRALNWLEDNQFGLYLGLSYAAFADLLVPTDPALARDYAERALRRAREGDPHGHVGAQITLARLSAAGEPQGKQRALRHLRKAIDARTGLVSARALALISLAAAELGVVVDATSSLLSLPAVIRTFERMGMSWHAERARSLQHGQRRRDSRRPRALNDAE